MATRGSRRLAMENTICLGVALFEAANGDSFVHVQLTEAIYDVVAGQAAGAVITINATPDLVVEVNSTSTVDLTLEIAGSLTSGDLVTLTFPPTWPTARGKAGGYICQGTYVAVVP